NLMCNKLRDHSLCTSTEAFHYLTLKNVACLSHCLSLVPPPPCNWAIASPKFPQDFHINLVIFYECKKSKSVYFILVSRIGKLFSFVIPLYCT
uniref:Uncharacterized protein n=1 Tax=Lates calcarifer TaxID=8187 RepID=A0A4W6C872_LATCA